MEIKRLLNTDFGVKLMSIVLGLGLATLFRKVCNGRNCMIFKGPSIDEVKKNTYKKNNKCYQFNYENVDCDTKKSIIDLTDDTSEINNIKSTLF
tara:strand:+ start:20637 stop:20918 length:282 start_codon:yes stop_codon:yes gene_type:complete